MELNEQLEQLKKSHKWTIISRVKYNDPTDCTYSGNFTVDVQN